MNEPETSNGLVKTFAHWCGVKKASGNAKRISDTTPMRTKPALEPLMRRKISCPEPVSTSHMTLTKASPEDNEQLTIRNTVTPSSSSGSSEAGHTAFPIPARELLKETGPNKQGSSEGHAAVNDNSSLRQGVDQNGDDQSETTPARPRIRKRGVTFNTTDFVAMRPPGGNSCCATIELAPPAAPIRATPSGGCKKLPKGRCRRFSDVMEYRQQVKLRRASCGAEASPEELPSSLTPLSCSALRQPPATHSHDDVTSNGNDVTRVIPCPRRRQSPICGRRSPQGYDESEQHRDAKSPTALEHRVKQLLRRLESPSKAVIRSPRSRRITLQRMRDCDLPYAGDNSSINSTGCGGCRGGGREAWVRARSQSLSAVDTPVRRRGGIVCANRDIMKLQGSFGAMPSGSDGADMRHRSSSAGEKRNVKRERSPLGGSVVPWQGDNLVVNVSALGRAMEEYLSGGLGSEEE